MDIIVEGTKKLQGSLNAPPSKSYTHRAIIASSLSVGESCLISPLICDDTEATIEACSSLGASIRKEERSLVILGSPELKVPEKEIDCRESASTIRFITPLAALTNGITTLTGRPELTRRPIGPLISSLRRLGVRCSSKKGFPPVKVSGGGIKGGATHLVGDVSSQFITGLLLACPLAKQDCYLTLKTPLVSRPYVELTLHILKSHRLTVKASESRTEYHIPGRQSYYPINQTIPGDYSSASFLLAAAAITNSRVRVKNLAMETWLPDIGILKILEEMGVNISVGTNFVDIRGGQLIGVKIDARDMPDLVPICAVLGCFAEGMTCIHDAERLRLKESNRLASIHSELTKMGARIVKTEDGLEIKGRCELHGAEINPHNDHRIAMACSVAALGARGKTKIFKAECVSKSYPNFFKDLIELGVEIHGG